MRAGDWGPDNPNTRITTSYNNHGRSEKHQNKTGNLYDNINNSSNNNDDKSNDFDETIVIRITIW